MQKFNPAEAYRDGPIIHVRLENGEFAQFVDVDAMTFVDWTRRRVSFKENNPKIYEAIIKSKLRLLGFLNSRAI